MPKFRVEGGATFSQTVWEDRIIEARDDLDAEAIFENILINENRGLGDAELFIDLVEEVEEDCNA